MPLFVVGINTESHSVDIRERYALLEGQFIENNKRMKSEGFVEEIVSLSTCNRVEHYIYSNRSIECVISRIFESSIRGELIVLEGEAASHHLFEVASGIRSQLIGEGEILGQVKRSYFLAKEGGLTSSYLNTLFQKAIYVGKKVRTVTAISKFAVSTGGIIIDKLKSSFSDIYGINILLIGLGEISRSVCVALYKKGIKNIYISNREYEKGMLFAKEMEANYVPIGELYSSLKVMDVVISSTTAPHYLITSEHIGLLKEGKKLLIDLAVPRDIEPGLASDSMIELINIDSITSVSRGNSLRRQDAVERVREIVSIENCKFCTDRLVGGGGDECINRSLYGIKDLYRWYRGNLG